MTFDFFEIGMMLGSRAIDGAPLLADWDALFPPLPGAAAAAMPGGLLVSVMMRGYLSILDRRPPGNVHAAQTLRFGTPAARDAQLVVAVRCSGKERRGDIPWLTFVTTVGSADGKTHLTGEMRSLWAA